VAVLLAFVDTVPLETRIGDPGQTVCAGLGVMVWA
jgi:hypothetical protein